MKKLFLFVVLPLMLLLANGVMAGSVSIPGLGSTFNIKVTSYKEARFLNVVKQQYDFSCGSAAIATLLTYHYDHPMSEQEVFQAMFDMGDKEKINKEGFSMLDMKKYLESIGYRADGYQISLEKLDEVAKVPAIVIINTHGYNHFVIVKGLRDSEVLIGDPAMGSKVVGREEFEESWNGLVFLVKNNVDQGRSAYDQDEEWKVRARAPFGTVLSRRDLAQFTVSLPDPTRF